MKRPTYDEWVEWQCEDNWWWEGIAEQHIEELEKVGIRIRKDTLGFDIYYRDINSEGDIHAKTFAQSHPEIVDMSAVWHQLMLEGDVSFAWYRGPRTGIRYNMEATDPQWLDVFQGGIFAGCDAAALLEADPVTFEDIEEQIAAIVHEAHDKILKDLTAEYEWQTSEELYQEWIQENEDDFDDGVQPQSGESLLQADGDKGVSTNMEA